MFCYDFTDSSNLVESKSFVIKWISGKDVQVPIYSEAAGTKTAQDMKSFPYRKLFYFLPSNTNYTKQSK